MIEVARACPAMNTYILTEDPSNESYRALLDSLWPFVGAFSLVVRTELPVDYQLQQFLETRALAH